MILTLSGNPGSGKSTVAKRVAAALGLQHYSVGDLRGKMALERGLTINQLNKLGEQEDFTDREADEYQKTLGEKEDNFVIDSRLGFHFIPQSFKVFLDVDPEVGAERIFHEPVVRPDEPKEVSVAAVQQANAERMQSDNLRYRKYYNLDIHDQAHYDLVINTSQLTIDQVVEKILAAVKK